MTEEKHKLDKKTIAAYAVLALLCALLLVVFYFFVRDFGAASRNNIMDDRLNLTKLLSQHQQTNQISNKDVGLIDYWMTFHYINTIFNLPPTYLRQQLQISSSTVRYPDITLGRYARNSGINRTAFMLAVRQALQNYLNAAKTK